MYPGRVTQDQLETIVEVDLDTFPDLTNFFDEANELTTELCVTAPAAAGQTPYTDHRVYLIELNLAAFCYCCADPRATSEKAGTISQSLQHKTGFNFNLNAYGQKAMSLDTNMRLAAFNNLLMKIEIPAGISIKNYALPIWKRGKGPWRNFCP